MAGGEGAKERRRLKRLQQSENATNGPPPSKHENKEKPARDQRVRSDNKFSSARNGKGGQKPDPKKFRSPSGQRQQKPFGKKVPASAKKDVKKSKKPKHLKRKFEQLGEDDKEAREKLLDEITQWDARKEIFSTQSKRSEPADSRKKEDGAAMNLDSKLDHETPFPRGSLQVKPSNSAGSEETESNKKEELSRQNKRSKTADSRKKEDGAAMNLDSKFDQETPVAEDSLQAKPSNSSGSEELESDKKEESSRQNKRSKTADSRKKEDGVAMNPDSKFDQETPVAEDSLQVKPSNSAGSEETKSDEPKIPPSNQNEPKNEPRDGTEPGSESSDDSDSEDSQSEQRRQRGRRRRGRKDTAIQIEESNISSSKDKAIQESQDKEVLDDKSRDNDEERKDSNDENRYCIGRKPVTDFVMNKSYPAKVVYVKPFGVFFDIGCHSDAFCHVSRLRDDYVESPETLFKEGDQLDARVVEIDRRKKRITVSLQSEARVEDERASVEARKHRQESMKKKADKKKRQAIASEPLKITASEPQKISVEKTTPVNGYTAVSDASSKRVHETKFKQPDESTMNPADLKRARKLARRSARREQSEAAQ